MTPDDPDLREFVERVGAILYRSDPIGLADDYGDNADEYVLEAQLIVAGLPGCRTARDVHRLVYETFVTCFDRQIAGDSQTFADPAAEIWAEWGRLAR